MLSNSMKQHKSRYKTVYYHFGFRWWFVRTQRIPWIRHARVYIITRHQSAYIIWSAYPQSFTLSKEKRKTQNLKLAWFGMVGSLTHSWSSAMSPFDRAPMTSDSPFLETRRLSCSPRESYRSRYVSCYLLKVANFPSARIYNSPVGCDPISISSSLTADSWCRLLTVVRSVAARILLKCKLKPSMQSWLMTTFAQVAPLVRRWPCVTYACEPTVSRRYSSTQ